MDYSGFLCAPVRGKRGGVACFLSNTTSVREIVCMPLSEKEIGVRMESPSILAARMPDFSSSCVKSAL